MQTITIPEEKTKAIGTATYETQLLADRLKKAAIEDSYEVIPYAELSAIIGADSQREGRAHLVSARRIVERDAGRLFGVVINEGIKLLTVEEQTAIGPDVVQKVKRATHRGIRRVAKAQTDKMTPEQLHEHNTSASVLGALHLFTRPKSISRIESAVSQQSKTLAIGETVKLFTK
jgi:hypothetical protein